MASDVTRPLSAFLLALAWLTPSSVWANPTISITPAQGYEQVAEQLERWVENEIKAKGIPGLSIALVDHQEVVWARGFGLADSRARKPATAETVYRVGSISKLFTDLEVMRLVEQGALDLDISVERYVPSFAPKPLEGTDKKPEVTLRQLMSHRSGLVRESPVGSYFDPEEPSLAKTIESLNQTALVYPAEQKTKYSNAGIALAGYIVERVRNQPFAQILEKEVLGPLELGRTRYEPKGELADLLAKGVMGTWDGRTFPAPTFLLGTGPAGNLYSNVLDLGKFLSFVFDERRGAHASILKPETLRSMLEPQFAKAGDRAQFGLGFSLGELDGHPRFGHGGAIYGFSSELAGLRDQKLGVVVLANRDCVNGVTKQIANHALRLMLAAKANNPLPKLEVTSPLSQNVAQQAQGLYEGDGKRIELLARGETLLMTPLSGGTTSAIRRAGDTLLVDGLLDIGSTIELGENDLRIDGKRYRKLPPSKPDSAPERWLGLLGEYGWDHNVLYILEREGRLHALIEWFYLYPLEEVSPNRFRFPNYGLYDGETLEFVREGNARAKEVTAAQVRFVRRPIEGEDGATFRIKPLRPINELRDIALAAEPPRERQEFRKPDLVDITRVDPTIKLEIRYATDNNFMGTPLYTSARAFMQRPVAEALRKVQKSLQPRGFGLLIHDSYRPWYVTRMFWDATPGPSKIFVADPRKGSRHNRGCAIDLTLYALKTGRAVPMVGGYDEFSQRSYPEYPGGTSLQRWHRELLRRAMEVEGFTVNINEWWHFDYKDWNAYPILNTPFEQIEETGAGSD